MTSDRRQPVLIVWSALPVLAVLALGAGLQTGTPDGEPPTAIEQALIERRCTTARPIGAPETALFQACLSAQFLSLRTDFGHDLGRLADSERKRIDKVCSSVRETRGRDAYVECVSSQLVTVHNRLATAHPGSRAAATVAPAPVAAPADTPAPVAPPAPTLSPAWWVGRALVPLLVAGGVVLLFMKTRRVRRTCRVCDAEVIDSGDLCQKCRHDAAETLRRAAAGRADLLRAEEANLRRQREHEEEQRRKKARQRDDDEARRQRETAQGERDARLAEQSRRREDEEGQRRAADVASGELLDPYEILAVPRDASPEEIRTAYQLAKSKYSADQVAHLGSDIQEHFKAKGEAVELAYQHLTA